MARRNPTQVTVREHLVGSVSAFIERAALDWTDTATALTELAVSLPGYREEETPLYPLVVLCDELNATIGGDPRVVIGSGPRNPMTAAQALKKCAPLAQGGWCIFLERVGKNLRYGVFRPATLSFAISPEDIFSDASLVNNRVCVVRSLARDVVELLDDKGRALHLNLSARQPVSVTAPSAIKKLVVRIVADAPKEAQRVTGAFLEACLLWSILDCHGTLIAVRKASSNDRLFQRIWLEEPIDLVKDVMEVENSLDKLGVARRQGSDHLIKGMIRSDGITLFSSDAKVLAFGGFVQLPATAGTDQGGARTRAFEALTLRVGADLVAALKVSQDGGVEYKDIKR